MTFTSAGTPVATRIAFNSGTLDFGSNRIVEVDNLGITIDSTIEEMYVLGSILPQDLARSSMKFGLKGKIVSFPLELNLMFMGSSTAGTPLEIDILDGQPTLQSPVLTIFDRNGKQIQYQFTGAVFKNNNATLVNEKYAEWDFELSAKLITILTTV